MQFFFLQASADLKTIWMQLAVAMEVTDIYKKMCWSQIFTYNYRHSIEVIVLFFNSLFARICISVSVFEVSAGGLQMVYWSPNTRIYTILHFRQK